jgi:bifunctional non-homologous end joining protein LigD
VRNRGGRGTLVAVLRRWEPMLATSRPQPPSLAGWVCEPKLDGWRGIVDVVEGKVRVTSRNGHDLSDRMPSVRTLAGHDGLVLDGELVHGDGSMNSFYGLLGALHRGSACFVAFDVLATAEQVLVQRPYADRRAVLASLELPGVGVVPSFPAEDLDHVLSVCTDAGMEGVVLKRRQSIYRPGQRSSDWRKVKCAAWREHLERRIEHLAAR